MLASETSTNSKVRRSSPFSRASPGRMDWKVATVDPVSPMTPAAMAYFTNRRRDIPSASSSSSYSTMALPT